MSKTMTVPHGLSPPRNGTFRPPKPPSSVRLNEASGQCQALTAFKRESYNDYHVNKYPVSPSSVLQDFSFNKLDLSSPLPSPGPIEKVNCEAGASRVPYLEAVVREDLNKYGANHPRVAAAMHDLAVAYMGFCQYELAESLLVHAVYIRHSTMGKDNMQVAVSLTNLALARKALQKYNESHTDLCEALRIARTLCGPDHVVVADIQSHLGSWYHDNDDMVAAQSVFEDCFSIYQARLAGLENGSLCRAMTEMLCNIGSVQLKRKDYKGAIASFTEALHQQEFLYGQCHELVITSLDNLVFAHCKVKDYDKALKYCEDMLTAQTAHTAQWNLECCRTIRKQNRILEKLEKYAAALEGTETVLMLQKQWLPLDHSQLLETVRALKRLKTTLKELEA